MFDIHPKETKVGLRKWYLGKNGASNLENRVDDVFVTRADEPPNGENSSNSNAILRCRPGFQTRLQYFQLVLGPRWAVAPTVKKAFTVLRLVTMYGITLVISTYAVWSKSVSVSCEVRRMALWKYARISFCSVLNLAVWDGCLLRIVWVSWNLCSRSGTYNFPLAIAL